MGARILICDDEANLREVIGVLLRRQGFETTLVSGVNEARRLIRGQDPYDGVITDLVMPDGSGMDVLWEARKRSEDTQIIMMTAYATTEQAVHAMRNGAYDYVRKPFKNDELVATLEKALEKRAIVVENRALRAAVQDRWQRNNLIGKSPAMDQIRSIVSRVASAPSSILITGESGTGKEMVAQAIHHGGSRRENRFVAVNCGALPASLMESELFGHEKGAFTGAAGRKDGLFRAADGGTIFLDEVADLPLDMQVKLLRVLQERSVRPVGGAEEVPVDVRVIAATNRDVDEAVNTGEFRQDLYYRLNVIHIQLPALRERSGDAPLLAQHFLEKHAAIQGRHLRIGAEAMRWIASQPYPGNIRELENIVERAVTLSDGPEISRADLPAGGDEASFALEVPLPASGIRLDEYLGDIEQRLLLRALEQSGGVRTRAAELVGMTFRSFRYRLAKYGLVDSPPAGDDESSAL